VIGCLFRVVFCPKTLSLTNNKKELGCNQPR
jgi:hypothetical protein